MVVRDDPIRMNRMKEVAVIPGDIKKQNTNK
jgi:hypothetical protein